MGYSGGLGFAFLCWAVSGVACYNPWDFSRRDSAIWRPTPRAEPPRRQPHVPSLARPYPWAQVAAAQPRAASPPQPVVLQCEAAQMVITVHRDLFGTGRLIRAADLSLGPAACRFTSLDAAANTVTFVAGLHECGSALRMTPDSLVYSTSLNYNPTPASNPVILRTGPAVIPIGCHYPRKDNVSSKAIKPTWVPFSSTLSAEERLGFSLRLMNDDWSVERASNGFQLGEVMHIQAEVSSGSHVALRIFVDSCVATLSPDRHSSPRYAVIDFYGCLVDGRSDDASSAFVSPRPRQDTLQFMVDVFRFAGDARNLIYLTCHLKVTAAEQAPGPLSKACSYNKAGNFWSPVEGTRNICRCCETGNCGLLGRQTRRAKPSKRWPGKPFQRDVVSRHGSPSRREAEAEADVMVGPLVIMDAYRGSRNLLTDRMEARKAASQRRWRQRVSKMPEGPELHLASCYINTVCAGLIFSGKVEKSEVSKNPEVPFESDAYVISAVSRGKEVKLTLMPLKEENKVLTGRERGRAGQSQNGPQQPMDVVFRFGMSGSFKFTPEAELPKHAHLRFYTKESPRRALCFVDFRRFGRWEVDGTWQLDRGPCVMLEYEKFRENVLKNLSDKAFNKPICEALLNQKFFNGIGNYLRAEILYRLKIPPFEKARTVLEALQHPKQSPGLTLSKKVKLKRENPDLLELCHVVPMEVVRMGGKGYGPEHSDDSAAFEAWLQCYYVPGMRSLRDGNGRTIWFQGEPGPMAPKGEKSRKKSSRVKADPEPPNPKVTKPAAKRRPKSSSCQEKGVTRSGRKKGKELVPGAEHGKAAEAREPSTRPRRKAAASQEPPAREAPAAAAKRRVPARRSAGTAAAATRSRRVKAE